MGRGEWRVRGCEGERTAEFIRRSRAGRKWRAAAPFRCYGITLACRDDAQLRGDVEMRDDRRYGMTSATIVVPPLRQDVSLPVLMLSAAVLLTHSQPATVATPALPCLGVPGR